MRSSMRGVNPAAERQVQRKQLFAIVRVGTFLALPAAIGIGVPAIGFTWLAIVAAVTGPIVEVISSYHKTIGVLATLVVPIVAYLLTVGLLWVGVALTTRKSQHYGL